VNSCSKCTGKLQLHITRSTSRSRRLPVNECTEVDHPNDRPSQYHNARHYKRPIHAVKGFMHVYTTILIIKIKRIQHFSKAYWWRQRGRLKLVEKLSIVTWQPATMTYSRPN